tara:strand:- start:7 stop:537 length:531 start_codon:yes stop_codon:yes gene_type:complete
MKKKGIVFWITGLSGSGKSTIAKYIKKKVEKKYGNTIIINGDDIRKIFNFKNYELKERKKLSMQYSKLAIFLSNQGLNIIMPVVAMFEQVRKFNKKNIKHYVEVYIETNIKQLINRKDKNFYKKKSKNIIGIDLKYEKPRKPDILIKNDFSSTPKKLGKELIDKIYNLKKLNAIFK